MLERIPVTAVISTKNEETAIADCIRSLELFAEVIVVDSLSSDRTTEIASQLGAKVVTFDWNGQYPKKKQWILENVATAHHWVLFVDADERPTSALLKELYSGVLVEPYSAFDIGLEYYWRGRELRHGHRVVKRALVRVSDVKFPEIPDLDLPGMGELEGHYQPETLGAIGSLTGRIAHQDPDPFRTWIDRHNKYSDWEAGLRNRTTASKAVRANRSAQGRKFDRVPFKPLVFFAYSYLFRLGFLDGRAGFEYAASLTWYYWVIDVKHREIEGRR